MSGWKDVPLGELPRCVETCERARHYDDPVFEGYGQWNCPRVFGVDHMYAVNPTTREPCRMWKRREGE